jgi:lysophospholipase L1-like esterase
VNRTRILLVACVALAAWAAWPKRAMVVDSHRPTRQLMISLTLARLDDAIIVLGDSIVEASTLPRSLCGHPIVNAGVGGASTESELGAMLTQALGGKRAVMIVVALGINDVVIPNSVERFGANYRALLAEVTALTPRAAIVAIPPPEAGLGEAGKYSSATIDSYNAILPELAKEAGAGFIALPAMPEHHTIDGVHLNATGYAVWDRAILRGIDAAVCKSA